MNNEMISNELLNIENLRKNICLMEEYCLKAVNCGRRGDTLGFTHGLSSLMDTYSENAEYIGLETAEEGLSIFSQITESQQADDYVLACDYLESALLPFLNSINQSLAGSLQEPVLIPDRICKNIQLLYKNSPDTVEKIFRNNIAKEACSPEGLSERTFEDIKKRTETLLSSGITAEFTSFGDITFRYTDIRTKKAHYLISNNSTAQEAIALCDSWYKRGAKHYNIYGLASFSACIQMLDKDPNITITILETNPYITELFAYYYPLCESKHRDRLSIFIFTNHKSITRYISDDSSEFLIHLPSLSAMRESAVKSGMQGYYANMISASSSESSLYSNFSFNQDLPLSDLKTLAADLKGKNIFIAAGGPSLDRNYKELADIDKTDSRLICVGTVLKKLLRRGILPDYCIITDPGSPTYAQISGLDKESPAAEVPLIFLATAFHKTVKDYPCTKKYMIFQKGFRPSEEKAEITDTFTIDTGGSVATSAFSLAVNCGASNIVFTGLDLAYTNNRAHASDTADMRDIRQSSITCKGINGETLYTAKNLNEYRKWFEREIAILKGNNCRTGFYDATEGGALIDGMKPVILKEIIHFFEINGSDKYTDNQDEMENTGYNTKKLTVIIPCYNVEKYVDRCLRSLSKQTIGIENIDIICIDDCSTDNTLKHLNFWKRHYPDQITVISFAKNRKQGTARNIGIKEAKTDYVYFLDADDWIDPDALEILMDAMLKNRCDMVCGLYGRDTGNGNYRDINIKKLPFNKKITIDTNDSREEFIKNVGIPCGLINNIISRKFIMENDLYFPEGITYEDNYLGPVISFKLRSIYIADKICYHYFYNPASTVSRRNDTGQLDRIKISDMLMGWFKENALFKDYGDFIIDRYIHTDYLNTIYIILTRFDNILLDNIFSLQESLKAYVPDQERAHKTPAYINGDKYMRSMIDNAYDPSPDQKAYWERMKDIYNS